ncbi:MAG: hypothetical protein M1832_001085 [Thelocarpon impressellum]|nr:MAG: hypothetical protein M1832_001085 [Thelocarpon impressellum]
MASSEGKDTFELRETCSNGSGYVGSDNLPAMEAGGTTSTGLQRKLKSRHIQMIAIGSNIGTGLFIGSGKALHTGGPLSLVLAFVLIAICLTIMMQCLGEMAVVLPVSGSFTRYASRFYDPALGFAMGWQYWLAWVAVFGAEASAFVLLINFWNSNKSLTALWITIFLAINLLIHLAPVRVFGEVEFYVSALKVISVIVFIIVVWAIMGGAGPNGRRHGGENWRLPGLDNGIANGFKGLGAVFVTAAFAAGGTEMVGVVAGEAQHPRYNLPRAIRTLMWRIFIFYIVSMLFLTFVVPYDSKGLVGGKDANSSPFVLAIKDAGIRVLPHILNAVVMICVCSVGSTSIYIASRTLKAMSEDGFAFKAFGRTDQKGRPYVALVFTGAIGTILAYLNVSSTGAMVFGWFSAISGMAFFIAWLVIIACNWRFRAALKAQGDDTLDRRFAFKQVLFPWLSIFAFVAISFMAVCQFIVSVWPIGKPSSAAIFFSNFLGVPIFLIMWAGYKVIYRSKWLKLIEVDLQTGRREEDPEEVALLERYERMSAKERAISYLHF